MAYHGNNKDTWTLMMTTANVVTSGGNNGITIAPLPPTLVLVLDNGSKLYAGYYGETNMI
jgi:hypothetical protein